MNNPVCYSVNEFCKICNIEASSENGQLCTQLFEEQGRTLAVVFKNGQMAHFIPVVNREYKNSWHKNVTIENNLTPVQLLEAASREAGYRFRDQENVFQNRLFA